MLFLNPASVKRINMTIGQVMMKDKPGRLFVPLIYRALGLLPSHGHLTEWNNKLFIRSVGTKTLMRNNVLFKN